MVTPDTLPVKVVAPAPFKRMVELSKQVGFEEIASHRSAEGRVWQGLKGDKLVTHWEAK